MHAPSSSMSYLINQSQHIRHFWKFANGDNCSFGLEENLLELLKEGAMMTNVLPKTLKNGTDMVADGELVIELTSGSCMFHICRERGKEANC